MAEKQITKMIKGFFSPKKALLNRNSHVRRESDELEAENEQMGDLLNKAEDGFPSLGEGSKVGRYRIVRKLGQGAAGVVYLGRDPYIKRPVAVKISHQTEIAFC